MPYQLAVMKGRSATPAVRINPGSVVTVGRQDGCQIRIVSSLVSRKHCELYEETGKLIVKDLGSSNGTFVDGLKIDGQAEVQPGQVLTIGNIVFRVEQAGQPSPSTPPGKPGDTAVAQAVAVDQDELDFEIEADDATTTVPPAAHGKAAKPGPAARAQADDDPEAPIELDENDVVDFLMDNDADSASKH